MKLSKGLIWMALLVSILSVFPSRAAQNREKTMYLGVVNGQIKGNQQVEVSRTLPESVLFFATASDSLPDRLIIRHATTRPADHGAAYVTVKQRLLGTEKEAQVELRLELNVDGRTVPVSVRDQGEDIVISVPHATSVVELRCDTPVQIHVPANYRGEIRTEMQIDGETNKR